MAKEQDKNLVDTQPTPCRIFTFVTTKNPVYVVARILAYMSLIRHKPRILELLFKPLKFTHNPTPNLCRVALGLQLPFGQLQFNTPVLRPSCGCVFWVQRLELTKTIG